VPEAKPYNIPKQLVWEAYQRVKANHGAPGVDGETLATFDKDLKGNLYKVWNRMSSGSYFPPPVRLVEIPKENGGKRPLGIPTVACKSEQQARAVLEAIRGRFEQCGLELHSEKTRIVYCKKDGRPGDFEHVKFDFLGYTFQPRRAQDRWGKYFVSFLPAISTKAAKAVRKPSANGG
jgi:hypothetical protein